MVMERVPEGVRELESELYCFAYEHYNSGMFEDSFTEFSLLYSMDPLEVKYLRGLGYSAFYIGDYNLCHQLLKISYFISAEESTRDLAYSAICHARLGEVDIALELLNFVDIDALELSARKTIKREILENDKY